MTAGIATQCPSCRTTLKLKSSAMVGKQVACPKCAKPFVVSATSASRSAATKSKSASDPAGEVDFADLDLGEAALPAAAPAAVRGKVKKPREEAAPTDEVVQPSLVLRILSALVWVNAHLAVAAAVLDSAWDLFWMLTHWSEFRDQMVIGRFATRQIGRVAIVIISALYIWWEAVLPRDIGERRAVTVLGGAYLLLFGAFAFVVGLIAQSVYERPIYAVQWSVVYLGASLLAFAKWGYAPETTLQRAERLTSEGRYSEALTEVTLALQRDPGNQDAYDLQRALRDMMRHV